MAKSKKEYKRKPEKPELELPPPLEPLVKRRDTNYLPELLMFLLGFGLYVNTIGFDYALDDKLCITHNNFTKQGFAGIKDLVTHDLMVGFYGKDKKLLEGGRYRPLALVTYAIEYELFGLSPHLSHFINALLYGIICMLIYLILLEVFKDWNKNKWWWSVSFVAALIYAVHPLHVEVVANIKGRTEMMAMLFGLCAMYDAIKYYDTGKLGHLIGAGICIALSLFSKEDGINFLGIIPLTLIFFRDVDPKKFVLAMAPLAVGTIVYLAVRFSVIEASSGDVPPELMNAPFLHAKGGERLATIMFTWGLYIKLLFLPHPLTHDYYPWHPLLKGEGATLQGGYPYLNWDDPEVIISAALVMGLTIIALLGLKKRTVYSYGILIFFGTFILYSNLLFDIGTFMNDRFMFIPSLGFSIIVAYVLVKESGRWIKNPKVVQGVLVVLLLGFSLKTISRNKAWENDFTLTTTDVEVSVNSAKCNLVAGGSYVDAVDTVRNPAQKREMLLKGIGYLKHSIELYPTYIEPTLVLGNAYYKLGEFNNSIAMYERCLQINPNYTYVHNNLFLTADTLTRAGRIDDAILALFVLEKYKPSARAYSKLGEMYGRYKQNPAKSVEYLNKALELEPRNEDTWIKLGTVYAMNNDIPNAMAAFDKGLDINPNNPSLLKNKGVLLMQMGRTQEGQEFINRAKALDPKQ